MGTVKEHGQRLLEDIVFTAWVGAGIAFGALVTLRWLLRPTPKSIHSVER